MPSSHAVLWRDPALPHVESRRACHSRVCYKAHSHPTFSIGAVDAGVSLFSGAADGQARLTPGTLVMIPAHRLHACNPAPGQSWSYQMLHVDADWLTHVRQESGLGGAGAGEPARICREPQVYAQFCELNRVLFSSTSTGEKEAALIAFLGDLDFCAQPPLAPAPALPATALSGLVAQVESQDPAQLSLEVLAREAGLGRYQLIRAFRAATGFTPHAYLLNARVNRGRQLLGEGEALAEVAYRLGFADQSHFQRVFKAHVGVTPGQYRGD